MLKLSKHFIDNWIDRVSSEPPSPEKVDDIIKKSVRVLKGREGRSRFSYIKTLTVYCHFGLNIIITVDHFTKTVVSVYSQANMPACRTIKENQ
ncbi:MAG: hypothetical protein V1793_25130 [Pseudomonadota bacterium]